MSARPQGSGGRGGRGGGGPGDAGGRGTGRGSGGGSFSGFGGRGTRGSGSRGGRGRTEPGEGGGRGTGRGPGGGSFSGLHGGRGGGRRDRIGDHGGGRDRGGGRGHSGVREPRPSEPPDIFRPSDSAPAPPSTEVRKVEDGIIAAQTGLSLERLCLTKDASLQPRPSYATQGTPVTLRTNYFHLKPSTPKIPLFQYSVKIKPDERHIPKRKRRRIFQLLWETPTFLGIRDHVASDSASIIISAVEVPLGAGGRKEVDIIYFDADQAGPYNGSPRYTLEIHKVQVITTENLISYLRNTSATASLDTKEEVVRALNIVMAKQVNAALNIVPHGQNKYFVLGGDTQGELKGGLVALRGYYSSVRDSNARILLNLNICTSTFYSAVSLNTVISEFLGDSTSGGGWPPSAMVKLCSFLKGLRVKVEHLRDRNGVPCTRVKRIIGLSTSPGLGGSSSDTTFVARDGGNSSVETYFRRMYNINLSRPDLPVVDLGMPGSPAYTPPELCTVIPGQPYKDKLSETQTRSMIRFACQSPAENARSITGQGCQVVGIGGDQPQNWLRPFGFTVDPNMLTVDGRVLQAPHVAYRSNEKATIINGSWNMKDLHLEVGAKLKTWLCLHLRLPEDKTDVSRAIENLTMMMRDCGVITGDRLPTVEVTLPRTDSPQSRREEAIKECLRELSDRKGNQRPKIILVILPSSDKFNYAKIKYLGDTKGGFHTVCVIAKKFAKQIRMEQYYANVALKFNLKCGGVNQVLHQGTLSPNLKGGEIMLVGIDVTHPSPRSVEGVPSIAGVVASIDEKFAQWPGSVVLQEGRKEMVTYLEEMMIDRLKLWMKKNKGNLPDKIIIYRDGVGESQYYSILQKELPQIREAIKKVYNGRRSEAKLAIVVVGKRHHTRFYPVNEKDSGDNGNPKNGSVVDRGITGVRYWDFYLQAHTSPQGTARPAHYVVVLDEIGLGADGIEQMTHNLCYLFGRDTKSVSVCPPAYYADLLCERGRCYIHSLLEADRLDRSIVGPGGVQARAREMWGHGVHEDLKESMFYI